MKKIVLFFLTAFAFSLSCAQVKEFPLKHEDFSPFLLNGKTPFYGEISTDKAEIKLQIEKAVKNPDKPEQYLVSGHSEVAGTKSGFSGEIIFTQRFNVNNAPEEMLVFADFTIKESGSGEHSGIFTGKARMQMAKLITKDSRASVTFKGKWKNYPGTLDFEVWWANFVPKDISKVVFK
jgi:hypothetical protein